jgi:hypothetical protein
MGYRKSEDGVFTLINQTEKIPLEEKACDLASPIRDHFVDHHRTMGD